MKKTNPVQMPHIPGVTNGTRENIQPPAEAAVDFKKPEEVAAEDIFPSTPPMTPDEETEVSSPMTEEERKELTKQKRAAALEKARAAKKKNKKK